LAKSSDDWKSFLLTLPERRFFRIYQHFLGSFETPFNKSDLVENLQHFVQRPEVQENMRRFLSRQDIIVLALIKNYPNEASTKVAFLFPGPVWGKISSFNAKIQELEDRLYIFSVKVHGQMVLKLSPALAGEEWLPYLAPHNLFLGSPIQPLTFHEPFPNETLLIAFLLLVREIPAPTYKKFLTQFEERVSKDHWPEQLTSSETAQQLLDHALNLRLVELSEEGKKNAALRMENFEHLTTLPPDQRWGLIWAGKTEAWDCAPSLFSFLSQLPRDRGWVFTEFCVLLTHLVSHPEVYGKLLKGLTEMQLLEKNGDELYCSNFHQQYFVRTPPAIKINSTFEITAEWVDLKLGLLIFEVATLKKYDKILSAEINKEAVFHTLSGGKRIKELIDALNSASASTLPQNVLFTLGQWGQEFEAVQIFEGKVLCVDASQREIVESLPGFHAHVSRQLAAGVYLISPATWPDLVDSLGKIGLKNLPVQKGNSKVTRSFWSLKKFTETHDLDLNFFQVKDWEIPKLGKNPEIQNFVQALPEDLQKEAFKLLAANGTIFTKEQLERVYKSCLPQEARGINAAGKVRLIQEALDEENRILEIQFQDETGHPKSQKVHAADLRRTGVNYVLVYVSQDRHFEININRISLIKSWRFRI